MAPSSQIRAGAAWRGGRRQASCGRLSRLRLRDFCMTGFALSRLATPPALIFQLSLTGVRCVRVAREFVRFPLGPSRARLGQSRPSNSRQLCRSDRADDANLSGLVWRRRLEPPCIENKDMCSGQIREMVSQVLALDERRSRWYDATRWSALCQSQAPAEPDFRDFLPHPQISKSTTNNLRNRLSSLVV